MDALLFLLDRDSLPRARPLPPPCHNPMTRRERVDLLLIRHHRGQVLWNPEDKINHDEMSKLLPLAERTADGHDCETRTLPIEEIERIIAEKAARRKGAA